MPTYIVSWDTGECMLVRCRDEEELIDHLDERGDPAYATWKVYRGQFSFRLRPKLKRAGGVPFVTYAIRLSNLMLDELAEAVTTFAFPDTREAMWEAWDRDEDAGLELLLHAEIESKGLSADSAAKCDQWLAGTFGRHPENLPDDERERRFHMLRRNLAWDRPDDAPPS